MATPETDPLQGFRQSLEGLDESMCLDAAKLAAQRIPEHEFLTFRQWVADDEPKRREMEKTLTHAREEAVADIRAEIIDQIAEVAPELVAPVEPSGEPRPWADWHPLKPETHFYYGDECAIDGRVFISRRDPSGRQPNVHSPLTPGAEPYWEEKPPASETVAPDEPEAEPTVAEYVDNRSYKAGDQVMFNGSLYECAGDHFAAPGWNPLNAHAYWRKLS